jgi:hypothetical protein
LQITSETPEVRKNLNKEEWVRSYYRGAKPASAQTKTGMLTQYLPWVAILLVVIVAFYFNSKMEGFGHTLDQVIGKINTIVK